MKKSFWISLIAGIAAVAAAAIAIAALVRRKTEAIAQELDFEPDDDYFEVADDEEESDEGYGEDCYSCESEEEEEVSTSVEEEPIEIPETETETVEQPKED
jgi:flagellar basal body-associated protein FliL